MHPSQRLLVASEDLVCLLRHCSIIGVVDDKGLIEKPHDEVGIVGYWLLFGEQVT